MKIFLIIGLLSIALLLAGCTTYASEKPIIIKKIVASDIKSPSWIDANKNLVPYIGATKNVDLGANQLTASNFISNPIAIGLEDTFEDGDYTANPIWTPGTQVGGTAAVSTNAKKNGTYGVRMTTDGTNDGQGITLTKTGLSDPTGTYKTWVRSSNASGFATLTIANVLGNTIGTGLFRGNVGKFSLSGNSGYTNFSTSTQANVWFKIELIYNGTNVTMNLYDSSDVFLESKTDSAANTGNVVSTTFSAEDAVVGSITIDFDDVTYTQSSETEPYATTSTTLNENLNAGLLDGNDSAAFYAIGKGNNVAVADGGTNLGSTAAGCMLIGNTANVITTTCSTTGNKIPVNASGTTALQTVTGTGSPVLATSPSFATSILFTNQSTISGASGVGLTISNPNTTSSPGPPHFIAITGASASGSNIQSGAPITITTGSGTSAGVGGTASGGLLTLIAGNATASLGAVGTGGSISLIPGTGTTANGIINLAGDTNVSLNKDFNAFDLTENNAWVKRGNNFFAGIDKNLSVVKSVNLIALTYVMCDMNFLSGRLIATTC